MKLVGIREEDDKVKMEVVLIHRQTNQKRYVSNLLHPVIDYQFALKTENVNLISEIVKKFHYNYRIIIVDQNGEVIKKI